MAPCDCNGRKQLLETTGISAEDLCYCWNYKTIMDRLQSLLVKLPFFYHLAYFILLFCFLYFAGAMPGNLPWIPDHRPRIPPPSLTCSPFTIIIPSIFYHLSPKAKSIIITEPTRCLLNLSLLFKHHQTQLQFSPSIHCALHLCP